MNTIEQAQAKAEHVREYLAWREETGTVTPLLDGVGIWEESLMPDPVHQAAMEVRDQLLAAADALDGAPSGTSVNGAVMSLRELANDLGVALDLA